MGYTTNFKGAFKLTPALTLEQKNEIEKLYDSYESDHPNSYCQWEVSEDGTELEWDGGEKFYKYIEWLNYINEEKLKKWNVILEGKVKWQGEEIGDVGIILAINGNISIETF